MSPSPPGSRVGWGFDTHPLNGKPPLVLGGVRISDEVGVSATSDGDVLAHALTDAVLGAAVLGDIGDHFPPEDPASQGANSMFFLRQAVTMARAEGWVVEHADATVVAEHIRIAPHRQAIADSVAAVLGLSRKSTSIKATSTDGLGFIGRGEGLAAVAVVTLAAV